ncbi:MAG: transporter substrate-binding domain-containing protein, partial [Clostridia bacterium]|nr:transporter substrate-binding domain-containing protein [Clostridia bacterium]
VAYITEQAKMIVGITYLEPLDFQDADSNWIGFDAELAAAVAAKLGVEVVFQEISWEAKEAELAAKHIDCIWNGLTITPAREEEMSISKPYMKNKQIVVVRADDEGNYSDVNSLAGKVIAAEAGSAGEEIVLGNISDAVYVEKSIQLDALTEVKALTSDAAVIDYVMANYLINKEGSDFADLSILDMNLSDDEFYGIAFRKGSDLTEKVNGILAELEADGTITAIAEKYALNDALVSMAG